MGVKDLWPILTPHSERKPMSELRGKKVAIDLAGWICESLNVVDYFVHPRNHLKNLFFRTCYLIWEEVTPVFVLEGCAPKLKSQVIAKRNELQFRGTKPNQPKTKDQQSQTVKDKGRTRFNHVLKQCEKLLHTMGVQCVQAPGEAEAYCAYLNKTGLVDGVISQDSDCFAYGAVRVYRNFSVSTQGAQAAQGGAVDIYDMQQINKHIDFGQNKTIVMALLCGCDYCPEGVGGIGRDGVLKLFNKYKETEILERIRSWRLKDSNYTALEMRVDDKTICANCGHLGRTQNHTKNGCGVCRTSHGCDESLWKEERLSIKAELMLRKKALADPTFPCEEIISEFLTDPPPVSNLNLIWRQPNIVKFIKQIGHLLQWQEIYSFRKFLPILTRWQMSNAKLKQSNGLSLLEPKDILKKRTIRGVASLEILWEDKSCFFNGLIPDEQLENFVQENPKGLQELWITIEPLHFVEIAYPTMVESFLKSKEKPKKARKTTRRREKENKNSLEDMSNLIAATDDIDKKIKPKRQKKLATRKGLQLIDKFFKPDQHQLQQQQTPTKFKNSEYIAQCSTPINKYLPSDLESDCDEFMHNISDIVNSIVCVPMQVGIKKHNGFKLHYEHLSKNLSRRLAEHSLKDDLDIIVEKRNLSICAQNSTAKNFKRQALDDSFDVLVNNKNYKLNNLMRKSYTKDEDNFTPIIEPMKQDPSFEISRHIENAFQSKMVENNVSYFFSCSNMEADGDAFEKIMELNSSNQNNCLDDDKETDCVLIRDSDSDSE